MSQLDGTGSASLRKLRRGAATVSLLIFVIVVSSATPAGAAQRPLMRAHPPAPFGSSYRQACSAPAPGHAQCLALVLTTSSAPRARPLSSAGPLGYGPADLQSAYQLTGPSAALGVTQTVAIVDAYDDPSAESDLASYRSEFGLSACTTANGCFEKVDQRGATSYPLPDLGWDGEISLDLDMVSAICPNCHILLVEADDTSSVNLGLAVNEAAALGATQISNSYGTEGEASSETSLDPYYNHPGVAVLASSGDDGYADCWTGDCYGANYPAVSPYVTSVGGTSLYQASTSRGWSESAWSGAGSGCSIFEPKPAWQLDPDCFGRAVADVSAVADPDTGVAVYSTVDGGWVVYGGTSAASPIVAGYDALIGPAAASPRYPYANPGSYFDVSTGTNGVCGDYQCAAGPGYDGPTGIGTPNGANLGCSASPAISANPSNQTVTAPAGASFTAAAVNPTGCNTLSVQWQVSGDGGHSWSPDTADPGNTTGTLSVNPTSTAQSGDEYRATFTNEHGAASSGGAALTVVALTPPPPNPTVSPHVSGAALTGATLSVSTGAWTGAPDAYYYAWFDCRSAGAGCSEVAAGTASYVTRASDANGRVYARVRAHNAGGWSGFVASDNSISPRPPGRLTVGQVKVSGMFANVALRCSGDTSCQATVALTVTETFKAKKLIAVDAAKLTKKVVVLARLSLTLGASRSRTVKATLTAAGQRLLPRHGRINVKLTVTQSGRTMSTKTLTFTRH